MATVMDQDPIAASSSGNSWRCRDRVQSVVEDQGSYSSTCGYCKSTARTSIAQGLWAYSLTVYDYQDLLDRGWRRSGMFLYKPNMKRTCCPPYTIRLKVDSFVVSKDQMRVLRRMQRYLSGKYEGPQTVGNLQREKCKLSDRCKETEREEVQTSVSARNEIAIQSHLSLVIEAAIDSYIESGDLPMIMDRPKFTVKQIPPKLREKLKDADGQAEFTCSIAFSIAALLKRRKKSEIQSVVDKEREHESTFNLSIDDIASKLAAKLLISGKLCGFNVKACNGHLNFLSTESSELNSNALALGTQKSECFTQHTGESKRASISMIPKGPMGRKMTSFRHLEMQMKRSSFDAEEYALYKKYQVKVHDDQPEDVKESSYRRFLVDSPLVFVPPRKDGSTPPCGFGSFHQQYRIDGRLVAVGVIDILPHCLSSKYFFWDPDFAFLSLGKYSALQEIKWVQDARQGCHSLEYYYLGFYIHSCPKMRYKAAYYPSELLCSDKFIWVPYEIASPILDENPYANLSEQKSRQFPLLANSSSIKETTEETADSSSDDDATDNLMDYVDWGFDVVDKEEEVLETGVLSKADVADSSSEVPGLLGDVLLLLNGTCLSFKQLEAFGSVPQWHLRTLVQHLRKYLECVGPALATRMAYVLT